MLPYIRCVGTIFSADNLVEKKLIKQAKSKCRLGWAAVHKNCDCDPQFTLPQLFNVEKAIELLKPRVATIQYKQPLHEMSSNGDNQRQRRLYGDRNSERNNCFDDESRVEIITCLKVMQQQSGAPEIKRKVSK